MWLRSPEVFRKPRHCFCHRPQSKQELQSTSCHRGTNLCATVLCLLYTCPARSHWIVHLSCTQDTCAACIFCAVRLVLVLHEFQVVCYERLRACRSCVGFPCIYLSSTRTSLFWAMNTCAHEACAVALALKASRPDKDEQRRLGGGEVELVRSCVQYYQASNLDRLARSLDLLHILLGGDVGFLVHSYRENLKPHSLLCTGGGSLAVALLPIIDQHRQPRRSGLVRIRCNLERQFVDPDATLLPSTLPAATECAAPVHPDLDVLVWELENAAKFLYQRVSCGALALVGIFHRGKPGSFEVGTKPPVDLSLRSRMSIL